MFIYAALALGVASAASTFAEATVDKSAQTPAAITVTSPTLKANETIPKDHTADGKNVSPALTWSGAPAGHEAVRAGLRRSGRAMFGGQTFVHWVVYKIPGNGEGAAGRAADGSRTLTAPPEHRRHDPGAVRLPRALAIAVPRRLPESRITTR